MAMAMATMTLGGAAGRAMTHATASTTSFARAGACARAGAGAEAGAGTRARASDVVGWRGKRRRGICGKTATGGGRGGAVVVGAGADAGRGIRDDDDDEEDAFSGVFGSGRRRGRRRRASARVAGGGRGRRTDRTRRRAGAGGEGAETEDERGSLTPFGSLVPGAGGGGRGRRKKMTPKEALRMALADLDASGWWAVISSGIVFGTFLLETYNVSSLGGWDILYRDDIPWYTGIISMQSLIDIEDAYNLLFLFELGLRAYAADFSLKFWTKPVTIVDVASTVPPLLAIVEVLDRSAPFYRFLRLLRVLRLLRLLDRSPDSVLFGLVKSDSMGVQLVGIGAEFICIFVIAAGVIYDLEYGVNPMVHNLNDTLYWAILTLTGIGQPFEVVTAGGRVATVISIIVALIVVPGQLAKLATISAGENFMRMMEDEEDEEDEEDATAGFVQVAAPNGEMVSVTKEEGKSSKALATRSASAKLFDDRECEQCGLTMHENDARFCRRCAARLPEASKSSALYKRKAKKKARPPPMEAPALPGMRLGIDTTNSIAPATRSILKNQERRKQG